jgi:hypothetical protein
MKGFWSRSRPKEEDSIARCKAMLKAGHRYDKMVLDVLARLARNHFPNDELKNYSSTSDECEQANPLNPPSVSWGLSYLDLSNRGSWLHFIRIQVRLSFDDQNRPHHFECERLWHDPLWHVFVNCGLSRSELEQTLSDLAARKG